MLPPLLCASEILRSLRSRSRHSALPPSLALAPPWVDFSARGADILAQLSALLIAHAFAATVVSLVDVLARPTIVALHPPVASRALRPTALPVAVSMRHVENTDRCDQCQ